MRVSLARALTRRPVTPVPRGNQPDRGSPMGALGPREAMSAGDKGSGEHRRERVTALASGSFEPSRRICAIDPSGEFGTFGAGVGIAAVSGPTAFTKRGQNPAMNWCGMLLYVAQLSPHCRHSNRVGCLLVMS